MKTPQSNSKSLILPPIKYRIYITISLIATGLFAFFYSDFEKTSRLLILTLTWIFFYCFFCYARPYFNSKKFVSIVPDFVQTLAISALVLIYGHLGLVFLVFLLPIIVADAFNYPTRKFLFIVFTMLLFLIFINNLVLASMGVLVSDMHYMITHEFFFISGSALIIRSFSKESRDIEEQKESLESELKVIEKERQEITSLFDNLDGAIVSLNQENRIIFANKSAIEILGSTSSIKLEKKNISEILIYENKKKIQLLDVLKTKEQLFMSNITTRRNGPIQNLVITPHYTKEGVYQGAVLFFHSLTKNEELDRKKVEFASIASHEIRTPLAVIEGYLNLILKGKEFEYDSKTKEYLKIMHQTATDLMRLANDILTVSKINQGSLNIVLESVDLAKIAEKTKNNFLPNAHQKGLKILTDIKDDIVLKTDQLKLTEIVTNLTENAIKFTEKGSVVITVNKDKENKQAVIAISDTGPGISKKGLEKIFEKFYQNNEWQTRTVGGTGLGLYISKSLANRLGGDISVESTPGKGSIFKVILPLVYKNAEDLKKHEKKELDSFIKEL